MKRILFLLSVWLALPVVAKATTTSIFVNTDCANNGNGTASTCAASVGAAGAYTTLDNAIAGYSPKNLVTNTTLLTIDLQGATQDNSTADVSGFTTDNTWFLTLLVQTTNRHPGYRDATKYTLASGNAPVLKIATRTMVVDGLQILATSNNNAIFNSGINFLDNALMNDGRPIVRNCLIIKTGTSTQSNWGIIFNITPANYSSGEIPKFYNNGIYGFQNGIRCVTAFAVNCHVHENTILNTTVVGLELFRFEVTSSIFMWNNRVAKTSGSDYTLTGTDGTLNNGNNITSDATSPNVSFRSKTCVLGPQTLDFRLGVGDTNCKDAGANIGTSGGTGLVPTNDDFIGTARPQSVAWDIGANEMIGTGPTPTPTPSTNHSMLSLGVGN